MTKKISRKDLKAKVSYRGWPGHFICGDKCVFHLNTLIEFGDIKIVVSTVGMMKGVYNAVGDKQKFEEIGCDRYYETMAFYAEKTGIFWDANTSKQITFDSEWAYSDISEEWKANKGHWTVVEELAKKLESGQSL